VGEKCKGMPGMINNDNANPTQPLVRKLIANASQDVRAGFVTKVYGVLSAQLLLTAAVAAPFVLSESVKAYVKIHGSGLMIGATVLNIAFLCCMICNKPAMRTFPQNYLLLGSFTVCEGIVVGVICAQYTAGSVLLAVVATAVLVAGLTAYAMYTKTDFTGMGAYLFVGLMVLMMFGLVCMFLPIPFMRTLYCCIGILLFSFYLIYDTQLIMGNGALQLEIDDYIMGALQLYLDIIQLFLYLLQLFGGRD